MLVTLALALIAFFIWWFEGRRPIADMPLSERVLDYKVTLTNVAVTYGLSFVLPICSVHIVALFGGSFFKLRADTWYWYLTSLVIYVVAGDLYKYWMHRLFHAVPALWEIHSFHHSAEAVTMITGARHHWMEGAVGAFFPLLSILFLIPPEIVLVGSLIIFFPDGCSHINFRFSSGRFVMWINTSQYHRIHHSDRPEHMHKNFAGALPLWDILFGTAYRPAEDEFPETTGLPDGDKPKTIWEGLIWPFRKLRPALRIRGV